MNITKVCFRCSIEQPISEFYKHKGMGDGHLNKCKTCTKSDSKKTEELIRSTPEGLEKDRQRHRDKYSRLGYKDKQKEWDKHKPWKSTSKYKNLNKKFKIPKGFELHHWNYNNEYLEDVFIMEVKNHRSAHKYLNLDIELKIFKGLDGEVLDTKERHLQYLINKEINI